MSRTQTLSLSFSFLPGERDVFRRHCNLLLPSDWAEQYRWVSQSAIPGKWRKDTCPYIPGIIDAAAHPAVREVYLCASPQSGKTEGINTLAASWIDQAPGPMLFVYPDEQTARDNMRDRLLPIIETSQRLSKYRTGYPYDESTMRISLRHMNIYTGWPRSAARLANKAIRYVFFEEADKYPRYSGAKEADPFSLGRARTITYKRDRKIIMISTPTVEDGPIWRALSDAEVISDYHVLCPECHQYHVMNMKSLKWPDEAADDPERCESRLLAYYVCPLCGATWDDTIRDVAVRSGKWVSRDTNKDLVNYLEAYRPAKIGFHVSAFLSPFVSFSAIAAAYLRSEKDTTKRRDFYNNFLAEPWVPTIESGEGIKLESLRDDRPRGVVPGGDRVACLLAAVDTQKFGFWYEIRAFGWGKAQTSWQIREGFVDSRESLLSILFDTEYLDVDGNIFRVQKSVIDAMGNRTEEVYRMCAELKGRLLPIKGEDRMAQPHAVTQLEHYPGSRKPIQGGLKLYRLLVGYYKDALAARLGISPGDPGAWLFHAETTDEWLKHMSSEYLGDDGRWHCREHMPNHGWDCSVYNLFLSDLIGVRFWKLPSEESDAKESKVSVKRDTPQFERKLVKKIKRW